MGMVGGGRSGGIGGPWLDVRGCSEASPLAQNCKGKFPVSTPRGPLLCGLKIPVKRTLLMLSTLRAWLQHYMVRVYGLIHNPCFQGAAHLEAGQTQTCFYACKELVSPWVDHMKRTGTSGSKAAEEIWPDAKFTALATRARPTSCLENGAFSR